MFSFTIICISFFVSLVHSSPLVLREVFDPTIITPDAQTVWPVGSTQTVTWETDNLPPVSQLTDPNGMILLGHLGPTGGENLDVDNPLAQNFPLTLGKIQITVPVVPAMTDYIIVLFGDSGNASPTFTITNSTSSGSSGSGSSGSGSSSSGSGSSSSGPGSGNGSSGSSSSGSSLQSTPPAGTGANGGGSGTPTSNELAPTSTPPSVPTVPATTSSSSSTTSSNIVPIPTQSSSAARASHPFAAMSTFYSAIGIMSLVLVLVT